MGRKFSPVRFTLVTVIFALLPIAPVFAHPGHARPGNGLVAGLLHPLLGWDHLLAMVTVGLMSAQVGGRALWLVPGTFILSMIAGGIAGMTGWELPATEIGIAISVLLLGVAVAVDRRSGLTLPLTLAGLFGFVHGQAHGLEMPRIDSPAMYAAGFVAVTIVLHAVGVIVGYQAKKSLSGVRGLRVSGAAVAIAGCWFLLGM